MQKLPETGCVKAYGLLPFYMGNHRKAQAMATTLS